jgi:hypothetical protein
MNASDYILSKQIQWAHNRGIKLVGSKGQRGRPAYTKTLEENLFQPLSPKVRAELSNGDGGELTGTTDDLPKMHAVHSSSALSINIFQYWLGVNQVPKIATACGFCRQSNFCSHSIRFEAKFPISRDFAFSPNIDVIIENAAESVYEVFAVECKFSEAYSSRGHSGIDQKYLNLEGIWADVPNLRSFSRSISPDDTEFAHLHSAQLVKHILGLKEKHGKSRFRLLYLWYDSFGLEGALHRQEARRFQEIAKKDNIKFHTLTYQKLIAVLADRHRNEHERYIKYITSRYF